MTELRQAREALRDAQVNLVVAREDLRTSENLAIERYLKDKTIGSNAEVRRSQVDNACAAERTAHMEAEAEVFRKTCDLHLLLDCIPSRAY